MEKQEKKRRCKYNGWLYVAYASDGLPEAVADSAWELAKMVGVPVRAIWESVSRIKKGSVKEGRFRKVRDLSWGARNGEQELWQE